MGGRAIDSARFKILAPSTSEWTVGQFWGVSPFERRGLAPGSRGVPRGPDCIFRPFSPILHRFWAGQPPIFGLTGFERGEEKREKLKLLNWRNLIGGFEVSFSALPSSQLRRWIFDCFSGHYSAFLAAVWLWFQFLDPGQPLLWSGGCCQWL